MKPWLDVLRRTWMTFVIISVIAAGGLIVYRLHGLFGSQRHNTGETRTENIVSIIPKYVTYEVYGPAHTIGMISYVDEHAQSQQAQFTSLPWNHTLTTTLPSVFANIVAQADSHALGCRILVNGELRDAQGTNGFNAMAFCMVKAA